MAASETQTQEAAAKQRIIKHMNADHHDSIRRYVEAYGSASMFQSRNARMSDITLTEMRFHCGNGQSPVITFDPPMKSLREARERLAQMDKESLQVLGRSDIPITTYIPPYVKLGHLWNFTQCLVAYALLPRPANFKPGSLLYETVLFRIPAFAELVARVSFIVFAIMLPIHLIETVIMSMKLAKHGTTFLDAVWWKWMSSCFVEGITSFWRLDGLIEEKRREKEAKKH
ncbi:hypothetical protein ACN47E_009994 [Coniothyrium glycines]